MHGFSMAKYMWPPIHDIFSAGETVETFSGENFDYMPYGT